MRKLSLVWALALVAPACGGSDGFDYDGTAGQAIKANFGGDLLADIPVTIGGTATELTVDTGAPMVTLDNSVFPSRGDGKHSDTVSAFNLTFSNVTTLQYKTSSNNDGVLGGDILRHFAFSLDYEGDRVWLSDPFDPTKLPAGVQVDDGIRVPFELRGGGLGGDGSSSGTVVYPPTRVMVHVKVEGAADPVWMLVDSGASSVIFTEGLYNSLAADANRPRMNDVIFIGFTAGEETAFFSRVSRMSLVGTAAGAPQIDADDVPFAVIPGFDLLASLSAETGVNVQALVGATLFRRYLTTVDYQSDTLHLARYKDFAGIGVHEFEGVGFQLQPSGQSWTTYEVYGNKDAYAKGLRVGDTIEQIGLQPLTGQNGTTVQRTINSYALGDTMPVTYRRGAVMTTINVKVEDLLPHYKPQ